MSEFGSIGSGIPNIPEFNLGSFSSGSFPGLLEQPGESDIFDPSKMQFNLSNTIPGLNQWGDWQWLGGVIAQVMAMVQQILASGGSTPSFGGSQVLSSPISDSGDSEFDFGSGTGYHFGGKQPPPGGKQPSPGGNSRVLAANPGGYNEHVPGNIQSWVEEAAKELEKHGIHMTEQDKKNMAIIAMHESGGDPNAINLTDGNAAAGHPSIGLVQTIQPTFDAYHLPGHDNIRNPVDNLIAGYLYAKATYGSTDNVPGIRALNSGGQYVGY